MQHQHPTYWQMVWRQFCKHPLGLFAFFVIALFIVLAIYAPLLASSKPLIVQFQGQWYFPLFRYLFYQGFFSKYLDIFYNLLMFTSPLLLLAFVALRQEPILRRMAVGIVCFLQIFCFIYLIFFPLKDPATQKDFRTLQQKRLQTQLLAQKNDPLFTPPLLADWKSELRELTSYAQLNLVLRYQQRQTLHKRLQSYEKKYLEQAIRTGQSEPLFPTLWNLDQQQLSYAMSRQQEIVQSLETSYPTAKAILEPLDAACQNNMIGQKRLEPWMMCDFLQSRSSEQLAPFLKAKEIVNRYEKAQAELIYLLERQAWLEEQVGKLNYQAMPFIRPFHWEDDAGGDQGLNRFVSWWDLTRINRKDMVASLIFGIRISLSVGLLAIGLALFIGIPIGAFAGYYGGKIDLISYRLIEIWESMPTFFMLLMVVAFFQNKSIFLVIAIIGLFGWTSFSRFIRGEFFKQKQLPYVEACRALGYGDGRIIFSHLLPNAIPPLLTLIPFAIMAAITSEAGLSFLGLGEEGSNSWGVLMDEGRTGFPAESYLLWPPALLLTLLLVAIALVGDSLRDALDPKLHT